MLFYVIAYLLSASGIVFVSWRLVKVKGVVSIARRDAATIGARLEETRRAARAAETGRAEAVGHAREALAQTGQALEVARNIELVSDQVQDLTDYLVGQIDGQAAVRSRGRHAIPAQAEPPAQARHAVPAEPEPRAVTGGEAPEGFLA